jgi:hypothetical protein
MCVHFEQRELADHFHVEQIWLEIVPK